MLKYLYVLYLQAVHEISISKCLILKETIGTLLFEVYGYGFVAEPKNVIRGCIEMEMPGASAFPSGIRRNFIVLHCDQI